MSSFRFPDRVYVVAELSANHGQSLETALATVRAAASCGADAIKVQTYTADTITLDCDSDLFQIRQGTLWDGVTLHQLYRQAEMPWEWHAPLQSEARSLGIDFFSSPFDHTAVDFLDDLGVPVFKIASFEIADIPLIQYAASKGRPMIFSTGIAGAEEIREAVEACRGAGVEDITLLKCTSAYPADPADANLRTIPWLRDTFGVRAGLSDHTMSNAVPVAAVALGAKLIEKHFILDPSVGGPDASFSLTPEAFAQMVADVRTAEAALGKATLALTDQASANRKFGRSLFIAEDTTAGEPLTSRNLRSVRPGDGLHPRHYPELIGRRAARDLSKGTPLDWDMLEP